MKKFVGFFRGIISVLVTTIAVFLKLPFLLLFPTRIVGRKNLKGIKTGSIVACNHFSNFDAIYLTVKLFPGCFKRKYLSKRELSKNKFFGFILSGIGSIFISRGTVDMVAFREVESALKSKKRIVIFPEGTRNRDGGEEMKGIKSGVIFFAKRSNVPIIPIRIEHRTRVFRFNRIIIGEPYFVQGKTEEEVQILENKFDELLAQK